MKIFIAPYSLKLKRDFCNSQVNERMGVLLKVENKEGVQGFSGLMPWSELGEANLSDLLQELSYLGTDFSDLIALKSPILKRAVKLAIADFHHHSKLANCHKLSDVDLDLPPLKSHYQLQSLPDGSFSMAGLMDCYAKGFRVFKIKCSRTIPDIFSLMESQLKELSGLRLRLDFNCRLSCHEFEGFLAEFPKNLLPHVDFFEDPTLFVDSQWHTWNESFGFRLAMDRAAKFEVKIAEDRRVDKGFAAFTTVVVKPTVEDEKVFRQSAALNMRRLVYTHNMDHPFSRMQAVDQSLKAYTQDPLLMDEAGICGDEVYEKNVYFELWQDYLQSLETAQNLKSIDSLRDLMRLHLIDEKWERLSF